MDVRYGPLPLILGILAMVGVGSLQPARAVPITASEPANMFGNLAQGATKCPNLNCGPTAIINSFVFLQNMYPKVYGNNLIGNAANPPTKKELVAAANNLACNFVLNCANRASGTRMGDFILGKRSYINMVGNGVLKGSTSFVAQMSQPWGMQHPFHPKAEKPEFVSDNTNPRWRFLYNQIKAGEDVEILVDRGILAHYLTLTSITFDPATNLGSLSVIDPLTGKATAKPLTLRRVVGKKNNKLLTNYFGGSKIIGAVAESPKKIVPAPEPASLAMLLVGCIGLLAVRELRSSFTGGGSS